MAQLFTTTLTFPTADERDAHLAGLGYRRLPVRNRVVFAADGFDDFGAAIITFATQHLADVLTFTFADVAKRRAAA